MTLAAFLPVDSVAHVRSVARNDHVILARSWEMLDRVIVDHPINAVVLDPCADGSMNIEAVANLLRRHPSLPLLAYVGISEPNLKAVLKLSKLGISQVLLHPPDKTRLWEAAERVSANQLSHDFLSFMGIAQVKLPVAIARAVRDLFERPNRYETAADIALEARSSVKKLYRSFEGAQLGSPKKLLTAAKMLRGYAYLRIPRYTVHDVCIQVGYSDARIFAAYTRTIFGCSPSSLKCERNSGEIVRHLLDWFYKP